MHKQELFFSSDFSGMRGLVWRTGDGFTPVSTVGTEVVAGKLEELVQRFDNFVIFFTLELVVRHLVLACDD